MKPRLWFRYQVWHCAAVEVAFVTGYGYTPKDAYDDWLRRMP
jgi:hypothetical protein